MSSATVIIPEGIRRLQSDLTKLVNNPDISDVVFVCQDKVEVHACRQLLIVRSSSFRVLMLQNGMVESGRYTVSLPTVESPVLIVILKYLYTAELPEEDITITVSSTSYEDSVKCKKSRFYQLDWNLLLKVVAARFLLLRGGGDYLLAGLRRPLLERLRADIPVKCKGVCYICEENLGTGIVMKLSALCGRLELYVGDFMMKYLDEIGSLLVVILASEDIRPASLWCLSKEALTYYLKKTQKTFHHDVDQFPEWSLEEYLRLRFILLWCAVRSAGISDIYSFDPVCLPGPQRVIQYLKAGEYPYQIFSNIDSNTLSLDREALMNAIDREELKPFLEMIELSFIYPELVLNVIKPLDIIKPELLTRAFGEQA